MLDWVVAIATLKHNQDSRWLVSLLFDDGQTGSHINEKAACDYSKEPNSTDLCGVNAAMHSKKIVGANRKPEPRTPPEKQRAKVFVEKRKGGRFITVVKNLLNEGDQLQVLLTHLKNACGAGGTIKGEQIEIQGDQAERIRDELTKLGYRIAK